VKIGEFIPSAYGFLQIAKRIDLDRVAKAVHMTWANYGFRPMFEFEDEQNIVNAKLPRALKYW
jgi:hypothetical protein